MNKEVKEKWVEALRSGEYKQGREVLRDKENRFCCLGVLCDIYSKEKDIGWKSSHEIDGDSFLEETDFPHNIVISWAGLENDDPKLERPNDTLKVNITTLNDDLEYDFKEIADLIEEQL